MRSIGTMHPTDGVPIIPDTSLNTALTGVTGNAIAYPAGATHMRLSGASTAGAPWSFIFNPTSTGAAWPSTASSGATTSSSGVQILISAPTMYQIPGDQTNFSLISGTSGIVTAEFWKKGG